jgi:hypothetical protein
MPVFRVHITMPDGEPYVTEIEGASGELVRNAVSITLKKTTPGAVVRKVKLLRGVR